MATKDLSIVNKVFQGSYRGHAIKIDAASTAGGRKHAIHEYPNRDTQKIEDLGLAPRAYDITIIVSSTTPDAYFTDKAALLAVLEKPSSGKPGTDILVHPFYGSIDGMIAVSWTMLEDSSRLGEGALSVVFEPNNNVGIPEETALTAIAIQTALIAVVDAQTKVFEEEFEVDESFAGNALKAIDKVKGMVKKIKESTSFIGDVTNTATAFANDLAELGRDVNSLITAPADLIASINGVMTGIGNLFVVFESTLKSFEEMFDFGEDDVKFEKLSSPTHIQSVKNDELLNSVMNVSALSGAYMASVQIEYSTVEEINAVSARLDEQFQSILADETVPYVVRKELIKARVQVEALYDQERVRAADLVPVYVNNRAARLIAFDYYGVSDRGEEIALLNSQPDVSFIDGNINILSE